MKVGQVTLHYYPITGGQQTYISNLIKILKNNGIESHVFQPYAKQKEKLKDITITGLLPVLHRLDNYISNLSWFIFGFDLLLQKRNIALHDIIISHYSFHYNQLKWHPKVIVLSHGVLWSKKLVSPFDKILRKRDLALKNNQKVFIVANDTHFLREIGYDIKPGEQFFGLIGPRTWFIPNCVDTNFFKKEEAINKKKIILVPRNIREDRGIYLAIEAFSYFIKNNQDFILKIVGGPVKGKYFNKCVALIRNLNLQDSIIFEGSIKWNDMVYYYNEALLTLIPTLEKEGTSLSALESMACGTPVVSTNVAGLLDLPCVQSNPEPIEMATKMNNVLLNLEYYTNYQSNKVIEIFNLKNWEEAWINIINQVNQQN